MSDKSYSSILARPSSLFIGIDLGTSGCRAIAIDSSGIIKAQAKIHYPDKHHKQLTPDDWWQSTQAVLKSIISKVDQQHIQAISVDGTSSTLFLCNHDGQPLTHALMYDDQSAISQADFLQQYAPKDSVVLSSTSGLAKILWLIEHHKPESEFHIVNQADWIAGQLCRQFNFSDINNVLKSGFDQKNNIWPLWILDLFKELKINRSCLPNVYTPGSFIKHIDLNVANKIGLPLDVKIIAGTTDSTAAFIASTHNKKSPYKVGQAVTSLGSTLVLKVVSDVEINDPAHGVYSQRYGQHWLVGGASNSGGAVLNYYFSEEQMLELTKQINPNIQTHLNYYPLLKNGERFPVNDPNLTARITPVRNNDSLFFQGLLEGIAEIEHTGYKLLERLGAPYPSEIKTAGGGSINEAWQQIRQQKLKVPVTVATQSAAAYGAAILAAGKNLQK